jgi:hypothetical protein
MEALLAENGDESPAKRGSLRWIAKNLLIRAGEETAAAREVGDRLDGKPAQAIIGGDADDPALTVVTRIERVIVDTKDKPE